MKKTLSVLVCLLGVIFLNGQSGYGKVYTFLDGPKCISVEISNPLLEESGISISVDMDYFVEVLMVRKSRREGFETLCVVEDGCGFASFKQNGVDLYLFCWLKDSRGAPGREKRMFVLSEDSVTSYICLE